ncbi:MAG: hypothetical protein V4719_00900 [Planctomycetota bacterium]
MLFLIGQSSITDVATSERLTGIGALGFAVWFGYHATSVLIPRIVSEHRVEVQGIVKDFRDEMRLEREAHAVEMKRERESHAADMLAQREACQREMEQVVNSFQRQQVTSVTA